MVRARRRRGFTRQRLLVCVSLPFAAPRYTLPRSPLSRAADHVLGPEATNADVFGRVARDIVRSVVAGYNGCSEGARDFMRRVRARAGAANVLRASNRRPPPAVFAYGQTAAGKTWTMQGDAANPGVLPQASDSWRLRACVAPHRLRHTT